MKKVSSELQVLLFIPNIIGYIRIILLVIAWLIWDNPIQFLIFFIFSSFLDMFDGAAARYFDQASEFGAWFDVVIDNFSRGMIWSRLYPQWGNFISGIEWLTFVCTHNLGGQWKDVTIYQPKIVKLVMSNGFYNPLGHLAIAGLWVTPIWLYAKTMLQLPSVIIGFEVNILYEIVTVILCAGRLIALTVESWFILSHIKTVLSFSISREQFEEDKKSKDG